MSDRFITITAPSLDALAKRYADAPRVMQAEMRTAMQRSVLTVEADAKREVDVDTGDLRRSITSEVAVSPGQVVGKVVSNKPHARAREFGRPPGKMPPKGVLVDWLRRHGIPEEMEYVIRRKIAVSGSPGKPYLVPALTKNRQAIQRELGPVLMQRVMAKLKAGR